MKNFIKNLEDKIKNNIQINKIDIQDNTHKHVNHKSFQKNKFHLSLTIDSDDLKVLGKVESHRKIMKILSKDLRDKIHALEIHIK